jgi:hypothetical protein
MKPMPPSSRPSAAVGGAGSLDADRVRVAEYLEDWLKNTSRVNVTLGIQRQRETHVREHLVP